MWQWKRAIYIWYTVGAHTTKNNRILYCTKIPLPHFEYSIFLFFIFLNFKKFMKISWIFINCHERYPAQKMYALILFDGDVFWSNPRTPVRGFARRSGDSSKHSKCQNLKILKTSKEVFKLWKKLSKSRFFRKIAFFRGPKCITIEDI